MTSFDSPYFDLHQLGDGIFAAIIKGGQGAWANAGIVDLGEETVLFDTFFTPQAALSLRAAAEAVTGRVPRYVINSHRHADHVLGNQVFPEATIIASAKTRELIATQTAGLLDYARNHPEYLDEVAAMAEAAHEPLARREAECYLGDLRALSAALPTLTLRLPDLTYERSLLLHGSKRTVELHCLGGGHTPSDAFLHIPDAAIAFVGDLALVGFHPSMDPGNPEEWDTLLAHIETLQLERFVPGHGALGSPDDLRRMRSYFTDLAALAAQARSAEELAALACPAPYDTWEVPNEFASNLNFFWEREQERRGGETAS